MVYSRKIKKEKRRIDKLIHFCSKVNTFLNTRLTNNNTSSIMEKIDEIHDKIKHDNDFLDNLELSGVSGMSNTNTALYNSPFLPGHTMAYDGKKSVPVANPLGSAALGMVNSNQMSLSNFGMSPVQSQVQNILNHGPPVENDTFDILAYSPMAINNQVSPAPPIVYPNPIIGKSRKSKYPPVTLPAPMGTYGQLPAPIPPMAPIVTTVSPTMGPVYTAPIVTQGPTTIMDVLEGPNSFDALTING
jgi:hypothetical protein